MSDSLKLFLLGVALVISVALIFIRYDKPLSSEEKARAAVEIASIEKLAAELKTANRGDIIEYQREGRHELWVVLSSFRNNERHDAISFQRLGAGPVNATADAFLADGVVLYPMGTPAWKEKALEFFKQ